MDSLVCRFNVPSFAFGVSACFTHQTNCRKLPKLCLFAFVYDRDFSHFPKLQAYFFVRFFMFDRFLKFAFWASKCGRGLFCCLKYRSAFWAEVHYIHLRRAACRQVSFSSLYLSGCLCLSLIQVTLLSIMFRPQEYSIPSTIRRL